MAKVIIPDIRFKQPFRRWLLRIYEIVPPPLKERYLEWLYPDDCEITFGGFKDEGLQSEQQNYEKC